MPALALFILSVAGAALAQSEGRERLSRFVTAPLAVGAPVNDRGVFELLNSGGGRAGYVFTTGPLAPLPGFSGAPIDMAVAIDLDGRFIDVRLVEHNEPIFVSGLGEAPLHKFLEQYRGHSIHETLVVGVPYGKADTASSLVYLDGVTKATASVRIAHESILAATLAVMREKMQGVSHAPVRPDPHVAETLSWQDLLDQGIAWRLQVSNGEMDRRFAGTRFEDDDPEGRDAPDAAYLDLYLVDLGPPSVARAVLDGASVERLQNFLRLTPSAEPILVLDAGRHGLVSKRFVRNTSPDWITATQDGLPVALRDADLSFDLRSEVPQGKALILRADRRLGFDPTREWNLHVTAVREHGQFMPELGSVELSLPTRAPARFFSRAEEAPPAEGPLAAALRARHADLIALSAFLAMLGVVLAARPHQVARRSVLTPFRLAVLAAVLGFVGWWGQGQLSVVTPLSVLRVAWSGGSYQFLLFDPFSLLVWGAAIIGFVLWGRGFFCGWLCPFGALQEFADALGRRLRLPQWRVPARWDARLKLVKYGLLAGLVAATLLAPALAEKAVEIEPFKTAISLGFRREWYFVAYAVFWLVLGLVLFKGFCRYVCPLGAVMALGGMLRRRDWIARRAECGTPCRLCTVRCKYQAISPQGRVDYHECFQCLDCVQIHDDARQCVPLILKARRAEPC